MLITNVTGGLGNQMFQYAMGYAVSKHLNTEFKLDIHNFATDNLRDYMLDQYELKANFCSQKETKKLKYKKENLIERAFRKLQKKSKGLATSFYPQQFQGYDENVFKVKGDIYFDGHWGSEKYFLDYRDDILKSFFIRSSLSSDSERLKEKINGSHSVSLHIRRGDYINNAHTNSVHGTCDIEYYQRAVSLVKEKVDNPHFFVFSDDLAWAKENLTFLDKITFVELKEEAADLKEMYLMSQCKNNIIANSTYSWWGAWLNENSDKIIIAPQKWFQQNSYTASDLVPSDWIKL